MAIMSPLARWLRTKVPGITASFDAWLNATVRSEFVLCELDPTKAVMGFAAVGGGAPNTYVVAFGRVHQGDIIAGGMYGKVLGVIQNDVALTAQTSIATVNADAGSFWWDEANELLYVHSTTGADPDSFTLVQAVVRFYLSNAPITLRLTESDPDSVVYYLPWLTTDIPRIRRTREGLLFGSMEVPEGTVSFINGHRAWWTLVAPDGPWNWKNRPARFYIGGGYNGLQLTRAQFAPMGMMLIEDSVPSEEACQFPLVARKRLADLELPITPYFASDYPNLGTGVEGTKKWIGYGRTTMKPDLTDASGLGVYTVADAAFQTLTAVHAVWAIARDTGVWTPLILTSDYTVNLAACTLTVVDPTFTHEDYEIAIDVTGLPITVFADIVEDILTRFIGATVDELDAAAFSTAAAAATNVLSLWVKDVRSLTSIFASNEPGFPSLGRSSMGTIQDTVEGKWTTSIWNANVDDIDITLDRRDFAAFAPQPKLKTIYPTVHVYYNFDHAREQWAVAIKDDPATRYRTGSREIAKLYTYLTDQTDAERLAQRYQLLAGGITIEAAFTERAARLCRLQAGGKVFVNFDPAPSASGVYANQPMELVDAEIVMAPKLTVSGRLGNFHGLGGLIGRWMPTGSPDWTSASEADRQASGFWCYPTGLADPGNTASTRKWF